MCKLRHKLCNAKKGVGPTFTWFSQITHVQEGRLLSKCGIFVGAIALLQLPIQAMEIYLKHLTAPAERTTACQSSRNRTIIF